jgi:hypothetical protein
MPYMFRGQVLGLKELAELRRKIEEFGSNRQIDEDMRAPVVRNWPDLTAKLPPEPED